MRLQTPRPSLHIQSSSISAPAWASIHLTDRNKSLLTRMSALRYDSISRLYTFQLNWPQMMQAGLAIYTQCKRTIKKNGFGEKLRLQAGRVALVIYERVSSALGGRQRADESRHKSASVHLFCCHICKVAIWWLTSGSTEAEPQVADAASDAKNKLWLES